jgi:ABC-type methionine transport system ATPase subunit
MIHTIESLKELHEQRFAAIDKALVLAAGELARRLDVLNHAHEQAREKERTFLGREAFETFKQRVGDDFALLRSENQAAIVTTSGVRETATKTLSEGVARQNTENEIPFGRIEGIHAKLIGAIALATFIFPLITGMLIYLLTKSP